jgi:hypothetical protein
MVARVKNPSAYNVYQKARHSLLKAENPKLQFTEINKLISVEWKSKTVEEKAEYKPVKPVTIPSQDPSESEKKVETELIKETVKIPSVAPVVANITPPVPDALVKKRKKPDKVPSPPISPVVEIDDTLAPVSQWQVENKPKKPKKVKTSLEKVKKKKKPDTPPPSPSSSDESYPSLVSDEDMSSFDELLTSTSELSEAERQVEELSSSDNETDEEQAEAPAPAPPPPIFKVKSRFF